MENKMSQQNDVDDWVTRSIKASRLGDRGCSICCGRSKGACFNCKNRPFCVCGKPIINNSDCESCVKERDEMKTHQCCFCVRQCSIHLKCCSHCSLQITPM